MKTVEINVYQFDELSDKAKQKAREWWVEGGLDYGWWYGTFDDANQIDCEISAFDIDRASYCDLKCKYGFQETATKILQNHGESCDTYQLAKEFNEEYDNLVEKYGSYDANQDSYIVDEENEYDFDQEVDELESEYEKMLGEEYLSILRKEYEWLTSEEQIDESIRINEYEFTEDGKIF